jgi:hypothetical protein
MKDRLLNRSPDDASVNFSLHLVTLSRDAVHKSLIKGEVPGPWAGTEEA